MTDNYTFTDGKLWITEGMDDPMHSGWGGKPPQLQKLEEAANILRTVNSSVSGAEDNDGGHYYVCIDEEYYAELSEILGKRLDVDAEPGIKPPVFSRDFNENGELMGKYYLRADTARYYNRLIDEAILEIEHDEI